MCNGEASTAPHAAVAASRAWQTHRHQAQARGPLPPDRIIYPCCLPPPPVTCLGLFGDGVVAQPDLPHGTAVCKQLLQVRPGDVGGQVLHKRDVLLRWLLGGRASSAGWRPGCLAGPLCIQSPAGLARRSVPGLRRVSCCARGVTVRGSGGSLRPLGRRRWHPAGRGPGSRAGVKLLLCLARPGLFPLLLALGPGPEVWVGGLPPRSGLFVCHLLSLRRCSSGFSLLLCSRCRGLLEDGLHF